MSTQRNVQQGKHQSKKYERHQDAKHGSRRDKRQDREYERRHEKQPAGHSGCELILRPHIVELISLEVREHGMAILCSGPGMGKTASLTNYLECMQDRGHATRMLHFSGLSQADTLSLLVKEEKAVRETADRVSKASRQLDEATDKASGKQANGLVLGLDDIAPLDEDLVAEAALLLRSMRDQGARIVMTMRPEAEMLAQALGLSCLYTQHLLVEERELRNWGFPASIIQGQGFSNLAKRGPSHGMVASGVYRASQTTMSPVTSQVGTEFKRTLDQTRGVPALVAALRSITTDGSVSSNSDDWGGLYEAMKDCLQSSLYRQPTEEDLKLRLAMIFLGRGRLRELEEMGMRIDPQSLACLQRDEVLYGVDSVLGTFHLAYTEDRRASYVFEQVVTQFVEAYPDVTYCCCENLARRGEFFRLGIIAKHADKGFRQRCVLSWPVELIDAGHANLVRSVVLNTEDPTEHAPDSNELTEVGQDFSIGIARAALACLDESVTECTRLYDLVPTPTTLREQVMKQQAAAFLAARRVQAGRAEARSGDDVPLGSSARGSSRDRIVEHLTTHAQALSYLLEGCFMAAFRMLLVEGLKHQEASLSSVLLCQDFDMARCLVGDVHDEAASSRSRDGARFLMESDLRDQQTYQHASLGVLRSMLSTSDAFEELSRGLACASRRGDTALEAAFMTILACVDARTNKLARAHVRAERATKLAQRAHESFLVSTVDLIDALALAKLGDTKRLENIALEGIAPDTCMPAEDCVCANNCVVAEDCVSVESCVLGEGCMRVIQELPQSNADRLCQKLALLCAAVLRSAKEKENASEDHVLAVEMKATPSEDGSLGVEMKMLTSEKCTPGVETKVPALQESLFDIEYVRRSLSLVSLSGDEVVLLKAAVEIMGDLSDAVLEAIPGEWARQLNEFNRLAEEKFVSPQDGLSHEWDEAINRVEMSAPIENSPEQDTDRLSICVLGGFKVRRGGKRIPETRWHRSASKLLLLMLVVAEGHSLSRNSLIEAIWPEVDYLRGRTNLYTALSSLRQTLGKTRDGQHYVTNNGSELVLNADYVYCDVDDFEHTCRRLFEANTSAANSLELAKRIQAIYEGNLYVPVADTTGSFIGKREELKEMYANAMICGVETALRTGDYLSATCFGDEAFRVAPQREDVVIARVCALSASGRVNEARAAYEYYAAGTIEETGTLPSARLRKTVAKIGVKENLVALKNRVENEKEQAYEMVVMR